MKTIERARLLDYLKKLHDSKWELPNRDKGPLAMIKIFETITVDQVDLMDVTTFINILYRHSQDELLKMMRAHIRAFEKEKDDVFFDDNVVACFGNDVSTDIPKVCVRNQKLCFLHVYRVTAVSEDGTRVRVTRSDEMRDNFLWYDRSAFIHAIPNPMEEENFLDEWAKVVCS